MVLFMAMQKQIAILVIVRKRISFLEKLFGEHVKTMDSIKEELLIDREEQAKELQVMLNELFESSQFKGCLMNVQENQCKLSRDD